MILYILYIWLRQKSLFFCENGVDILFVQTFRFPVSIKVWFLLYRS